jgi:hypothetical protein
LRSGSCGIPSHHWSVGGESEADMQGIFGLYLLCLVGCVLQFARDLPLDTTGRSNSVVLRL